MKLSNYIRTTRFKTTLWYSSIFLLLEIVIGLVIYFYLESSMSKQLDISLRKQTELIYHFVSESIIDLNDFKADSIFSSPDELVYDLIFEAVAFNPTNTFIQVYFKDKMVFKTANLVQSKINILTPKENEIELSTFSDSLLSKHPIRAACLNKNGYKIIAAYPIYLINETLESLIDIYVIITPIFFLLSLAGGALISFRSLSRMDMIIKKTTEITTQNLNEIIEGEEFDDEYGRLVKTMNKMIIRIKTSIDYMNQFSIAAAHELKTPLTILRGEIELALKSEKTPSQYKSVLQSNYEETLRLIKIIEHLFYLSKLDNSVMKLNKDTIPLEPFIDGIVRILSNIARGKKIRIAQDLSKCKEIKVSADAELLKQVIFNLLDNAIKYSNANTEIVIKCITQKDGKVYLSFTNIGETISKEEQSKLFDRFYRTETSRNRGLGGVGLGLSIVKSIVDLHNWKIFVECSKNQNITFTIII